MSIWDTLAAPVLKIIDKVIPDRAAAQAAKDSLTAQLQAGALQEEMMELTSVTTAQSDVNKVEAASSSVFVAGWRPAIGWVCACAFGFEFILRPMIEWGFIVSGHALPAHLPRLDDALTQLTYGMLGMGALRSIEKVAPTFGKK